MMKQTLILPALLIAAVDCHAGGQSMIARQSELSYVATQMGVPVEGAFGRFSATIDLDPNRLQASSVTLSVDTSSVDFPSDDVLKELAKPDWFDSAHFPVAEFRSMHITALGGEHYQVAGTLTIKGRAHQVVVPVSLSHSGATTFASGAVTIKRLDYALGARDWADTSVVADEVQIKFRIAMSGAASG